MFKFIKKLIFPYSKEQEPDAYYDRLKLVLSSLSFAFIVATYSILKPLKKSIFYGLVGVSYQPVTRYLTLIALIPAMFFYSGLIDKFRRYQIIIIILSIYAVGNIFFAFTFYHPIYGLTNTAQSSSRILGWAFHLFIDFYQPFALGSFWSFSNSIFNPTSAKNNYGFIVATSKVAGMLAPLLSILVLNRSGLAQHVTIPLLVLLTSIFVLISISIILRLQKHVPGKYLHGYEAAYELEKQKSTQKAQKPGFFEGLRLLVTQPYVFGIFGLVYAYEIVSAIFDYQMDTLSALKYNNNITLMTNFQNLYTATFQGLGLFFAVFGTSRMLRYFDVKFCLLVLPIVVFSMSVMLALTPDPSLTSMFLIMVVLRALHYGFNHPIKEILYIPTTKDIKFKSSAWVSSFGRSISKTSGSTVNLVIGATSQFRALSGLSAGVATVWTLISIFVGNKYLNTIKNGKVIGADSSGSEEK